MDFKSRKWQYYDERDEPYGDEYLGFIEPTDVTRDIYWWDIFGRHSGKTLVGKTVAEVFDEVFTEAGFKMKVAFDEIVDFMKPVIEVTEGHWAVCEHKPRCKKPPAHANLKKSASQSRRTSGRWTRSKNFNR